VPVWIIIPAAKMSAAAGDPDATAAKLETGLAVAKAVRFATGSLGCRGRRGRAGSCRVEAGRLGWGRFLRVAVADDQRLLLLLLRLLNSLLLLS
jgi:hypothetical protein